MFLVLLTIWKWVKVINPKEIGIRIKEARKAKKITQNEAAKKSGISRSYYADVENGRYSPSMDTLINISKALNVSTSFLLEGKEDFSDLSIKEQTRLRLEHIKSLENINYGSYEYLDNYLQNISDSKFNVETINLLSTSLRFAYLNEPNNSNDDPVKIRFLNSLIDDLNHYIIGDRDVSNRILLSNLMEKIQFILK